MAKIKSFKYIQEFNPKLGYFDSYQIITDEGSLRVSQYKIINYNPEKIEEGSYIYPCGMVCDNSDFIKCDKNKMYKKEKKCEGQFFYILKDKIDEKVRQ